MTIVGISVFLIKSKKVWVKCASDYNIAPVHNLKTENFRSHGLILCSCLKIYFKFLVLSNYLIFVIKSIF